MDNKYYTPSIEEFHIGFEYEHFCDMEWNKVLIKNSDDFNWATIRIDIEDVRVKYLDKDDIESLGWFCKDTTDSGQGYFWETKTKQHSIIYNYTTNRMIINMRGNVWKEDYTAFVGTINNKSELKKLIKQLGIVSTDKPIQDDKAKEGNNRI